MDLADALKTTLNSEKDLVSTLQDLVGSEGLEAAKRVALWTERVAGEWSEANGLALFRLGQEYHKLDELEASQASYNSALRISREVFEDTDAMVASILDTLSAINFEQGRLDEAETNLREVLQYDLENFGENDRMFAHTLFRLAQVLVGRNQLEEAEMYFRQLIAINDEHDSNYDSHRADHLIGYAEFLIGMERDEEARPLFDQALAIFKATLPADHPDIATVEAHIANLPPAETPNPVTP